MNFVSSIKVEGRQKSTHGVPDDVGDEESDHGGVQITELVEVEVTKIMFLINVFQVEILPNSYSLSVAMVGLGTLLVKLYKPNCEQSSLENSRN